MTPPRRDGVMFGGGIWRKKSAPCGGTSIVVGNDRLWRGERRARRAAEGLPDLVVIVVPAIIGVLVTLVGPGLAKALARTAALIHEAIELFAILGLVQIGHIGVEVINLGIEPGAFFLKALELFAAILVKGCVAARIHAIAPVVPVVAGLVGAAPGLALVPVSLGFFRRSAEFFTPQDIAEHGQTQGPEDDKAHYHECDGQGRPLWFDDCCGHFGSILPVTMLNKWPLPG